MLRSAQGPPIVDNYATYKHPQVHAWLAQARPLQKSIVDIEAAINRYLAETNDNPKPFTWTAEPDAIIEKVRRGNQALESIR